MAILWYVLGALVVVTGLVDVFLNVLAYDAVGLPVERSYRIIWRAVRAITRYLPDMQAGLFRALGAPLMVVWTISGWLALQILGFALIYYPAVTSGSLSHARLPSTFWTPLYFSVSTISSLSFSDVRPISLAMHFAAAAEALSGFGILTLGITYVLGLYQVVQDEGAVWSSIQHHGDIETGPLSLLAPHFYDGATRSLSPLWRDLHQSLIAYLEGMRRYPLVYYFHVRQQYRSLPYMFWFIGEAASAVRWGLPGGHRAAADPWLPGLLEGCQRSIRDVESRFMTVRPASQPPQAGEAQFIADRAGGRSDVQSVSDFLELERSMAAMADVSPSPDHEEAYERYQQWWTLVAEIRAFVQAASTDFGMKPVAVTRHPAGSAEAIADNPGFRS